MYATGGGGTGRVTEFLARRTRDGRVVRGVLTSQVFRDDWLGSYGIAAYLRAAPSKQWKKWDKTIRNVQRRITALGNPPDWTYVR